MSISVKKILFLFASIISLLQFSGCNTIDGIGEDLQQAGEKLQESSN